MEFKALGRTDIHVSAVGLGVMTFGSQTAEDDALRQMDMALAAGVTLFDTAENYPSPVVAETHGRSEEMLGRWIAARGVRGRIVVATKVAGPGNAAGDMKHIRGEHRRLDRANIRAAVDTSLQRLKTDHIDLYQLHWSERAVTTLGRQRFSDVPDAPNLVPIAETVAALGEMVTAGKIRHFGVCNESPWGVMQYLVAAEAQRLPRAVTIQNAYSLLDRQFEIGLAEVAMRENVGLLAHSPLMGGVLSGKYTSSAAIAGSRSSLHPAFAASRLSPKKLAATSAYAAIAQRHGISLPAMALAFIRQRPFATSVLMAARTAAQLEQNLKSVDLKLSKELVKEIDAVHDETPNPR